MLSLPLSTFRGYVFRLHGTGWHLTGGNVIEIHAYTEYQWIFSMQVTRNLPSSAWFCPSPCHTYRYLKATPYLPESSYQ